MIFLYFIFKTLARCLILWDDILPNSKWVDSNVPQVRTYDKYYFIFNRNDYDFLWDFLKPCKILLLLKTILMIMVLLQNTGTFILRLYVSTDHNLP